MIRDDYNRLTDVNAYLLQQACINGDAVTAADAIGLGADVNAVCPIALFGMPKGSKPLHLAATHGHGLILSLLVEQYQADPDALDGEGSSAAHIAVQQNDFSEA